MMALERFATRSFAVALQATPDAPGAPVPAVDGLEFYDGRCGTDCESLDDPADRLSYDGRPFATHQHRAWLRGSAPLLPPLTPGSQGSLPAAHALLMMAGMTPYFAPASPQAVRYVPVSESIPCGTLDAWIGGTYRRIFGARAAIDDLSIGIGQRPRIQAQMIGWCDTISEAAATITTAPAARAMPAGRADNALARITTQRGTIACWARRLAINFGTRLTPAHYTGWREVGHNSRNPSWSFRMARTAVADFDPYELRSTTTPVQISLRTTSDAGYYVEAGIRGLIRDIRPINVDGDYGWEISGPCIASSAGGDEFYVEFGGGAAFTALMLGDTGLLFSLSQTAGLPTVPQQPINGFELMAASSWAIDETELQTGATF